jgi:hypothetical protein
MYIITVFAKIKPPLGGGLDFTPKIKTYGNKLREGREERLEAVGEEGGIFGKILLLLHSSCRKKVNNIFHFWSPNNKGQPFALFEQPS